MGAKLRQRFFIGLGINAGIIVLVLVVLAGMRADDVLRSNVITLVLITQFVALFVWVPIVVGSAASSSVWKEPTGLGSTVLVLRVDLPDRAWAARRFIRSEKAARLAIEDHKLQLTWADGAVSNLAWATPPIFESRRVRVPYQSADSVVIRANSGSLEYVPFDKGRPLRGSAHRAYMDAMRDLTSHQSQDG